MATRRVSIRLTSENFEKVKADLLAMGPAGEAALRRIQAATEPASRGLLNLNRLASGVGGAFRSLTGNIFSVQGAILALAGGGIFLFTRHLLENADALAKQADRLGLSVEETQKWVYAADLAGVEGTKFEAMLRRINVSIGEARAGNRESIESFRELGINIEGTGGKAVAGTEAFLQIADAYQRIGNTGDFAANATKVLGRDWATAIPLIQGGRAELQRTFAEREKLGLLTEREARSAERVMDQFTRIGVGLQTQFTRLILSQADNIDSAAGQIIELIPAIGAAVTKLAGIRLPSEIREDLKQLEEARDRLASGKPIPGAFGSDTERGLQLINARIAETRAELEKAEKAGLGFRRGLNDAASAEAAQRIRDVQRALREEGEQLTRTADDQKLYTELKKAGLEDLYSSITATTSLTMRLGEEETARSRAARAIADQVRANQELVATQRRLNAEYQDNLRLSSDLQRRADAIRESIRTPEESFSAQIQEVDVLLQEGRLTADEHGRAVGRARAEYFGLGEASREAGQVIGTAFEDAILKGEDFRNTLRALAQDMLRIALRVAVTKPLENALTAGISSFFAPSSTYTPGNIFGNAGVMATAHGAAFGPSGLYAFAGGGVVDRPTFFGFGGGRRGVMGEAGPEAVIPLARDSRGNLGVKAQGGGQSQIVYNVDMRGASIEAVAELRKLVLETRGMLNPTTIGGMMIEAKRRGGAVGREFGG